ncbi:MAG: hypothetical protein U1B78_02115 [Dehalococcoidia bacterium]|nr:hypothetical protein [Dehalococcoidia bacterium]
MHAWHLLGNDPAPEASGVYELGTREGAVIYIGTSPNLAQAIARHLHAPDEGCRERAVWFRYEQTATYVARERALLLEYQAAHGSLPPCN